MSLQNLSSRTNMVRWKIVDNYLTVNAWIYCKLHPKPSAQKIILN